VQKFGGNMALRVDSSSTKVVLGLATAAALAVGIVLFLRHRRIVAAEPTAPSLALKAISVIRSLPGIGRAVKYFFPMKAAELPDITIGSPFSIENVDDLAQVLMLTRMQHKELGTLIIRGDDLQIVQDPGILALNPKKLILVGAQIVHSTEASSLEQCMINNGWLANMNRVIVVEVDSVKNAVKYPIIINSKTAKPMPTVYTVKA